MDFDLFRITRIDDDDQIIGRRTRTTIVTPNPITITIFILLCGLVVVAARA